ncbi:hypothetical protein QZM76_29530, partial [Burkholderia multivorans]|nr:hypothetical protein [Burkholderia multivorans]
MKLRLLKRDQIAAVAQLVGLDEKVLLELLHRHRHVPDAHSRPSYFAIRCFFREPHTSAESIIKCNTPDLPCTRPCRRPMGTRYQHLSAEERATIMIML